MREPSSGGKRATVFEATNTRRRKIYATWTFLPIFEAMANISKELPSRIAHWRPEREEITFRSLEFELSDDGARAFVTRHVAKPPAPGWKYIVDRSSKNRTAA